MLKIVLFLRAVRGSAAGLPVEPGGKYVASGSHVDGPRPAGGRVPAIPLHAGAVEVSWALQRESDPRPHRLTASNEHGAARARRSRARHPAAKRVVGPIV